MQRSVERAAENESTFRRLNEVLEEKATELGLGDERTPYLCECENERCTEVILLTRLLYETVRVNPRAFVVVPGHQEGNETVLQEDEAFMVIEKLARKARSSQSKTLAPNTPAPSPSCPREVGFLCQNS